MIELRNVYKTFTRKEVKIEALKGISLKVEKGDIFGVIGYSGAGKSTLIRLVNYLERPSEGQVLVDGYDLGAYSDKELRAAKKNIGMIFQHFNLLESKKVFDNVAIPLVLLKKSKAEIRKRVEELLEFVGLSDKAGSYPSELSGDRSSGLELPGRLPRTLPYYCAMKLLPLWIRRRHSPSCSCSSGSTRNTTSP